MTVLDDNSWPSFGLYCLIAGWPIPHWRVTLSSVTATIGTLCSMLSCWWAVRV